MAVKETIVSKRHGGHIPRTARATGVAVVEPPPLESGDRLTRHEFEWCYEAMPHIQKAELIEGVVYMSSPVRVSHGESHGQIMGWCATYCAATPGVHLGDSVTVRLDWTTKYNRMRYCGWTQRWEVSHGSVRMITWKVHLK
jgi:hypothetical protein